MKKNFLPTAMILLMLIFSFLNSSSIAQQPGSKSPNVSASLSVQPDISGLCIGATVTVPIHISGDNVLGLDIYLEYDHSVLTQAPGSGIANVFPGFSAVYNYAYNPLYPSVSYLGILGNGFTGTNFTGEKLIDLLFIYQGGSTTIHFRTTPDPTPPALCNMLDEFGFSIAPITFSDNVVSGYPNLAVGSVSANQTICSGAVPALLQGVPPSNGTLPEYQWQSSTDNTNFSIIIGATDLNYQPAALTTTTYYRQLQNASNTCLGPLPTNSIGVMVNPNLPVSVSIDASANPVCSGTAVTFTATPVNGGTTPVYHWQIDGFNIPGATNSTFINIPGNGDMISCVLNSSETCVTGNPATSNVLTMIVNPFQPVSVAISASATAVCEGTTVTFTAVPANGGLTPAFLWKVNGVVSGTNSPTFSYVPVNLDLVTCELTSSEACVTGNPATSNTLAMTVNPLLPVSVSISGTAATVCAGTSVTYTAFPTNGGLTPAYLWKVNGITSGTNSPSFTYVPANNDIISCELTSGEACVTGNPATSNTLTMTVNPVLAVSVTISASATSVCAGASVTYTAIPTNGGLVPVYLWKVNGSASGSNSPTFTYVPVNNDVVTCELTSDETCATGNPATSNSLTMTVNPILPVSVTISASETSVCGGTLVTYTAISTNGGETPVYQWMVNGTNAGTDNSTFSYVPVNNDVITCMLTSSEPCVSGSPATSNSVTMTVGAALVVGSISADQSVCTGTVPALLTSVAPSTGTSPVYQWQSSIDNNSFLDILGATTMNYQPDLLTTTTYFRQTQDALGVCGGPLPTNVVTIAVNPIVPVSVTINASANPVCTGTPVTFTALAINGGTTPSYQWMLNGVPVGTDNPAYTYTPANSDMVACILTSGNPCSTGNPATSNTVTITVFPNLLVGSISADQTICAGVTPAILNGVAPSNGTAPTYQWQSSIDNSSFANIVGATMLNYQPSSLTATTYFKQMQDAMGTCDGPLPTNTVTITVNPLLPVSVSITANVNSVCAGTSVTFTAIQVNGGTTPAYQWIVNGTPVGTDNATYSYIPANNDVINCVLTSSEVCTSGNPATSNAVTMIVNPILPVSVSISADVNPVCAGGTVNFTATPVNGGFSPLYQWMVNGANAGTGTSTFSYIPVNNDIVTCKLISSEACNSGSPATSNAITLMVDPVLLVGSISADQTICSGIVPAMLTAVPPSNGTAPIYQWQSSLNNITFTNISGATMQNYQPDALTATTYYLQTQNATGTCGGPLPTNVVTITVNPTFAVGSISASQSICTGTAPALLNGTAPTGGDGVYTYQWQTSTDNVLFTDISGATDLNYQPGTLTATTYYQQVQTGICGGPLTTNVVTITVQDALLVGSISADQAICSGVIPAILNGVAPSNGTAPIYQWQSSIDNSSFANIVGATMLNYQPSSLTTTTYFKQMQNASGICNGPLPTNTVTITVNPLLPVSVSISADVNPVCAGTSVTFTATQVNGGTTPAYQWIVNGTPVGTDNATYSYIPANNDVITCVLTSNEVCTSGNPATSNAVTMIVNPILPVSVSISADLNPSCTGGSVTFTATPVNGGLTPAYQWMVNGSNAGTGTSTFSYVPVNGDVVTCMLTSSEACISGSPATSNAITMVVEPVIVVGSISADQTICSGTVPAMLTSVPPSNGTAPVYQWQSSLNNITFSNISGATQQNYQPDALTATTYYLQTQNATGTCGGPLPTNVVTITVNPTFAVGSISASQSICTGTAPALLTGTAPTGGDGVYTYQWQTSTDNVLFTDISGATDLNYQPGILTATTYYQQVQTGICGGPLTTNVVTITVQDALLVGSISADQTICSGVTPAILNGVAPSNGTAPIYQWQSSIDNSSFANIVGATMLNYQPSSLTTTTYFKQMQNASGTCDGPLPTNTVTITVNPLMPVSVSISADVNPVCAGTSVTFTAMQVNGGTTPAYQWIVNGAPVGTDNATYSYIPANNDVITCVLTSSELCTSGNPATSNTVTMTVNPILPVSVSISADVNPVCAGGTVNFTATPVNGGLTPAYQWMVNGANAGTGTSTFAYVPVNGDIVTCMLTSSEACNSGSPATSNAITMVVEPVLVVGSISADQTICSGVVPSMLTSVPPSNGTAPIYQWQSSLNNITFTNISGATMQNYQPDALTATTYYLQTQNATGTCGGPLPTNVVTITVNPTFAVGSISADQSICAGNTPAPLTGIAPTGGDGLYTYQWQESNDNATFTDISGATDLNYVPGPLSIMTYYRQIQTGTCGGPLTTNTITITIDPPLSVGSIAADQTICEGFTPALLTGTAPSNGNTPTYQWQSSLDNITFGNISGATALNYQPGALTVTTYYQQIQNASATCGGPLPTNVVTISVTPLIVVGSISADQTICFGTIPAQLNGVGPMKASSDTYQWQSSTDNITFTDIPGASSLNYQPGALTVTTYFRQLQDKLGTCGGPLPTNVVTITVTPDLAVGSISADQTICANAVPAMLIGVAPSNGTSPIYQWQSSLDNLTFSNISGATSLNYQPGTIPVTTYFQLLQDASGTCGGPMATNVVTITASTDPLLVPGSIGSDQVICVNTAPALLTGTPPLNGTSPTYQWQSSLNNVTFTNINGATALDYQPGVLTATTYYQLVQNASVTCGGPLATNVVKIDVTPDLLVGSISANQSICAGNIPALLTGIAPSNGTSPTYQWQSSLDNTTFTNILGATMLNYQPGVITATTYFRQLQDTDFGTCGGPLPTNVVTITFNPDFVVGSISADQAICAGDIPAMLTGIAPSTGTSPTYQWQSSLNNVTFSNISGATALNYQPGALSVQTYFRQSQNATGTCGGPLFTNVVTISINPGLAVGSISADQSICAGTAPALLNGVAPANGTAPIYQWQSSLNNSTFTNITGATSLNYQPGVLAATTYFRLQQNATGTCGGPLPTNVVTITVNPVLTVGSISASQSICSGSVPALLTGVAPTGSIGPYTYQWESSLNNVTFTNINGATALNYQPGALTAATYYRQIQSSACGTPVTTNVVTISILALPVPTVAGPASVCLNSTGNVYTTEAGMTGYTWTVSAGGTITAGTGTNAITVTWSTVGANTVTVNYTNANNCTAATATIYNVTVNPLPVPTVTGPASICENTTGNVYTTEAGMTGYAWTVSAGGTITAGGTSTSNTVTVTWTTTGAKTVCVNYANANNCTAAAPTCFNVTVNALPVPTVTGPASVCVNSTGNVYTTEAGMTGYTWTVSAGGTITAGTGTNAITVSWTTTGAKTVCVNYANANGCTAAAPTCNNVTVNALPVPTITGPATACLNSTGNVYTTQTGMTGYTWTVSAGGTITAGTGTNAITVTWTTTGAKTVCVNYANANGCTAATPTCFNVTVNALPVPTITGPATACVNTTGNVYTTETGMTGYTWTVSAGGTITAGTGTNAITVTWGTAGAKTVCVNYTNAGGCTAAAPTCYNVTVNALPTPTVTGPALVCQGASATYTTQAGNTNYVWTVSPGGTITSGGTSTSNTVTVTWTALGAQTVTVNYSNGCSAATPGSISVTVNAAPVPTIGSTNTPCVGSTNVYYTESGMTGYVWQVSAGGTIVSTSANTATISWTGLGPQWVSVNYVSASGCSAAQPTVYNVFVNSPPNAAGPITGTAAVCAGTNGVIYTTTPVVGAVTYTWVVPATMGTIVSGQGTTSITVNFITSAVSGTIFVAGTNQCGDGPASSFAVTVNPLPAAAGTITGPASVCAGSTGVYTVPVIANATGYVWTVSGGATFTQSGNSITVTFGSTPASVVITVKGTNTCGSGIVSPNFNVTVNAIPAAPVVTANGSLLTSSIANGNQWYYEGTGVLVGETNQTYTAKITGWYWSVVTVNGCSSDTSNHVYVLFVGQEELSGNSYNVYPVPNDGKFNVSVNTSAQETFTIQVFNLLGEKFYERNDVTTSGGKFDAEIDLRPLARGIYTVIFLNGDHKVVRKMIVNK